MGGADVPHDRRCDTGMTSSAAMASFTVAQPKRPAMMMRPKRLAESPRARRSAAEERSRAWLHYSKIKNLIALSIMRKNYYVEVGFENPSVYIIIRVWISLVIRDSFLDRSIFERNEN